MKVLIQIVVIIFLIAGRSFAQVPVLEIKDLDKDKVYPFAPYLSIWIDTTTTQTIADIISPLVQQKFTPLDVDAMDIIPKSFWLKCEINNLHQDSLRLGLQIGVLEQIDIYLLNGQQDTLPKPMVRRRFKAGIKYDYLTIPPSRSTLYFHITRKQDFSMVMVRYVLRGISFFGKDYSSFWTVNKKAIETFTLLYFGGLLLLFFYNLVLYLSLRDKNYLFYLLSLFFWGLFLLEYKDLYIQWIAPAPAEYAIWLRIVPPIPWVMCQLLFVRSLLKLSTELRWANYLTLSLVTIGATLLLLLFVTPFYPYILSFYIFFIIISHLVLLEIAVVTFFNKKGNYRFYFIGNIVLIITVIIFMLDVSRLIPSTIYSANAVFLGSLIEMALFSLALTDKISESKRKLIAQELRQAREKEILIAEKNKELSEKVAQRTIELQTSNATKDKLFSIISHDLRSPIAALGSAIDILDPNILNSNELEHVKHELTRQFKATDDTLQNLLLWARVQMQGEAMSSKYIKMRELADKNIDLLYHIAMSKKIILKNEITTNSQVVADENYLRTILRNLISNAIKFSYENSEVIIFNTSKGEMEQIAIKDMGKGMSEAQKTTLFADNMITTKGTSGEIGTGLGLNLVKNLVEKSGGNIWVESEEGKGSTFWFSLPRVNNKEFASLLL